MLPVIYCCSYPSDQYNQAEKRLKKSLESIKSQTKDIIIIKRLIEPFNKAKILNYAIKKYSCESEYFIISDIDIIWPPNTIELFEQYIQAADMPLRIVPYCIDKSNHHKNGFADGNGLIHIPSFLKIHGYDESYVGYGPESHDLNKRLAKINGYIELPEMVVEHIPHELSARVQVEKNIEIYENSMRLIDQGDLVRNKDGWGNL